MFATFVLACCSIAGIVHGISGTPLGGANLRLRGPSQTQTLATGRDGKFAFPMTAGSYELSSSVRGYAPLSISVRADRDVELDIAMEPLDSAELRQIGRVTVDGRLTPVRGTIPAIALTRSELDALGDDRVIDGLAALPGATFARPNGGAASAVAAVALRGPDPSESLVAIDGQLLNDGNTGDLDLSQLPVAAFSSVDVTEGFGPEDSNGSNTFGGAIDLVSLRPTKDPHQALSLSSGSFGRSEAWINATGSVARLGYAFAADDRNERGFVNQSAPLFSASDPTCMPCSRNLGSAVASHALLGALAWSFSQSADVTARVFVLGDDRDQSSALNGIDRNAADSGSAAYGAFAGPGEQSFAQTLRAYQIRGRAPLGAGELSADFSESDNSVSIGGGGASPYDVSHADRRDNGALTWQRSFAAAQFAVGGYTRYESLASRPNPLLGQTIVVLFARGGFQPVANLRLDGGVFESRYSTFGSNLDGRASAIYTADRKTSVRFSAGTGFRAPLLIERYAFPYAQLPLDGNGVFLGQGSADERPEHATEYELGASHKFTGASTLDVSLYRTNLRNPIEIFYPLAAAHAGTCAANSYAAPNPACVSYQGNVGTAVYEGAEFRYSQRLVTQHLLFTARYGINVAYPKNFNSQFSNPTSGGNLVSNAQFLGIPQQQGSLQFEYDAEPWHAAANGSIRGKNNELGTGPFAIVNAVVGRRIGSGLDLSLAGTNLFNADAGRFTLFGAGEPYRGIVGRNAAGGLEYGPLPTDALRIEPAGVRAILTLRR